MCKYDITSISLLMIHIRQPNNLVVILLGKDGIRKLYKIRVISDKTYIDIQRNTKELHRNYIKIIAEMK